MAILDTAPKLEITRVFNAPPEMVFDAWIDPKALAQWWGPKDFQCTSMTFDARAGGLWRGCMVSPDGKALWVGGVVKQVEPPKLLSFTFIWDANDHPGHETLVTIIFRPHPRGTEMHFLQEGFATVASRDGHNYGWSGAFDDLERMFA